MISKVLILSAVVIVLSSYCSGISYSISDNRGEEFAELIKNIKQYNYDIGYFFACLPLNLTRLNSLAEKEGTPLQIEAFLSVSHEIDLVLNGESKNILDVIRESGERITKLEETWFKAPKEKQIESILWLRNLARTRKYYSEKFDLVLKQMHAALLRHQLTEAVLEARYLLTVASQKDARFLS